MADIEKGHTSPIYETFTEEEVELAAKAGHGAMQAVCEAFGIPKLGQWELCSDWYKASLINQVEQYLLSAPSCRTMHNRWVKQRKHQGWELGEKDRGVKQHPHLMDFNDLPVEIKLKLKVFRATVMAFRKNEGPKYAGRNR